MPVLVKKVRSSARGAKDLAERHARRAGDETDERPLTQAQAVEEFV